MHSIHAFLVGGGFHNSYPRGGRFRCASDITERIASECAVIQAQSPRCECGSHLRFADCSPYHPQTNGKLERFRGTLKARVNLRVFTSPEALRAAMVEFIESCTIGATTKESGM
jgi:hypothetical protein